VLRVSSRSVIRLETLGSSSPSSLDLTETQCVCFWLFRVVFSLFLESLGGESCSCFWLSRLKVSDF
jgi:hypothetical protein